VSFLESVTALMVVAVALSMYRVVRGPSLFDRLAGLGLVGTKTIVLLLLMGFAAGDVSPFVDIALSYGLIGFIGSLALAAYFEPPEDRS
jgi:multicomponent Na+:H+ antiporter subunit F